MAGELENFLTEWSERRDISASERDEEGKVHLIFDGRHEVSLSQLGSAIYIESDLTALPSRREEAEDVLERLMKLQLAQARKGEDVLSITEDNQSLTMFRTLRANRIDLNEFEAALGAFVNSIAFMSSQLETGQVQARYQAPMSAQILYP